MGENASSTVASQRERENQGAVERPESLTADPAPQDAAPAPAGPVDARGEITPGRAEQASDEDAGDRRKGPRHHGRGGNSGLYPPKNPGRSTRMIGEVVVDLGFSDAEAVEEA